MRRSWHTSRPLQLQPDLGVIECGLERIPASRGMRLKREVVDPTRDRLVWVHTITKAHTEQRPRGL